MKDVVCFVKKACQRNSAIQGDINAFIFFINVTHRNIQIENVTQSPEINITDLAWLKNTTFYT